MPELNIGLPKGSLQDATFNLLARAGWKFNLSTRSYYPTCDDHEVRAMLARPQEMSRYVERGVMDMAITGLDWTYENESDVEILAHLVYAKATAQPVRWVLAVPEDSHYRTAQDLEGKTVSTEVVNLVRNYFKKHNVKANVEFSHGATEVKVPYLADAIVDVTETGSSLRANRLRIIDTVQESVTVVIANKSAIRDSWKKDKISAMTMMLKGALNANGKVLLKMNTPFSALDEVLKLLGALRAPTVNTLSDPSWRAVECVMDEGEIRTVVPQLKAVGAQGIIELQLNKLIL